MKARITQCLLETRLPEPTEIPVWQTLVKEGKNLPNSVTEDVNGFSLMPYYSAKQLRRIGNKQKRKNRSLAKSAKREWRLPNQW